MVSSSLLSLVDSWRSRKLTDHLQPTTGGRRSVGAVLARTR